MKDTLIKRIPWDLTAMSDDLRKEYQFDYRQAKRNRFAAELPPGGKIVYLEPNVAAAFGDSDVVNDVLRSILKSLPQQPPQSPEVG